MPVIYILQCNRFRLSTCTYHIQNHMWLKYPKYSNWKFTTTTTKFRTEFYYRVKPVWRNNHKRIIKIKHHGFCCTCVSRRHGGLAVRRMNSLGLKFQENMNNSKNINKNTVVYWRCYFIKMKFLEVHWCTWLCSKIFFLWNNVWHRSVMLACFTMHGYYIQLTHNFEISKICLQL